MKRGDFIWVECEGEGKKAMVILASPCGDSLMVMFDGFCGGFVGMMPLLRDEAGRYHELVKDRIVAVTRYRVADDGKSITCFRCGAKSWHPEDVRRHYCGNCYVFHDDSAD